MSTHLNNICLLELCLGEPLFGTFSVLDVESPSPLRRWIFQNFVIEPRMISSMLVWLIGAKLWNMLCLEVQKIRPILRPSLLVFGAPVRCFVWTTSPTLSGRLISPPLDGHLPQDPVEGLVGNFSSLFFKINFDSFPVPPPFSPRPQKKKKINVHPPHKKYEGHYTTYCVKCHMVFYVMINFLVSLLMTKFTIMVMINWNLDEIHAYYCNKSLVYSTCSGSWDETMVSFVGIWFCTLGPKTQCITRKKLGFSTLDVI